MPFWQFFHKIQKLFWPKDFSFEHYEDDIYKKDNTNVFPGPPNPGFRSVKVVKKTDSQDFKNYFQLGFL